MTAAFAGIAGSEQGVLDEGIAVGFGQLVVGTSVGIGGAPAARADQPAASKQGAHYVWREGYEHGGRWRRHWVLVR